MTIHDVENNLSAFENSLKEFESHLSSKTAARVLTSYVWMQEQLENKLNRQLKPLLRALETLQTEDKSLKNNIDASTKHAKELILTLQDLIITYKQAASMTDMQIKWNHILRKMKEHTTHLRNRTNITKGLLKAQKEQEKDPRSWLPF